MQVGVVQFKEFSIHSMHRSQANVWGAEVKHNHFTNKFRNQRREGFDWLQGDWFQRGLDGPAEENLGKTVAVRLDEF